MKTILMNLYQRVLRLLNLGERRCAWCSKLLGLKFGLRGATSHGICKTCQPAFEQSFVGMPVVMKKKARRQRPSRKTLRRTTGGWSGAVALR